MAARATPAAPRRCVGGLVFALAPYRVAQSAGHLRGPISALLPLALWAFERSRRGSRWWLVGAVAALASIPFSDVHLALGAIPFFLLYALSRGGLARRWPRDRACGRSGSSRRALLDERDRLRRALAARGGHYSATGLDFVARHPRHGLESFVFLGWLTPLLALAGLVLLLGARRFWLGGGAGRSAPSCRSCSRWGRTSRSTQRSGITSRRCATRACRSGRCPSPASRSRPSPRSRSRGCAGALVAALLVLVAADLRASIYEAAAAEPGRQRV